MEQRVVLRLGGSLEAVEEDAADTTDAVVTGHRSNDNQRGEQEECRRPDDGGVEGGQERANGGLKELPGRGLQVLGAPPDNALIVRREQAVEADGDDTRQADVA